MIIPNWPAPSHIKAYSTSRAGGFSKGKFSSLNLNFTVGDNETDVAKNRLLLMEQLSIPSEPRWIKQIHSAIVTEASSKIIEADASFTRQPKIPCVVMTADCLPLLICNHAGTEVAAIHAGWRGLAGGIIENCLQELATSSEQLMVWLGPAIGPAVFEVGDEVRAQFLLNDPEHETAFVASSPGKWLANIYQLARQVLHKLGVSAIYGGTHCTYTESDLFFSYRRDQGETGRMASIIWINIG